MTDGEWTREGLIELARGRILGGRSRQAAKTRPPQWLLEHAVTEFPFDSSESLEVVHPDDRGALVDAFMQSNLNPGELVAVHTRSNAGGEWHHSESLWLNLADQPDVGMILFFVSIVDGPPIEPPADDKVGEHAAIRWMVWTVADNAQITDVEGASSELLGYEPQELVGRALTDFLPADTVADGVAMWVQLHESAGNTTTGRRQWVRRDGTRIWIDDLYLKRVDRHGAENVLAVLWDATDRIAQEDALRRREEELVAREAEKTALASEMQALALDFRILADEVPAAVFRCDLSGVVSFHNARWAELIEGRDSVTRLHDIVAPEEHRRLDEHLAELMQGQSGERRALEVAGRDGTRTWRVSLRGAGDERENLVGSLEDVTDTVELRHAARHDRLTGLPNRNALEEHLAARLAVDPTDVLVFFVDLDGFKLVNDTWGHERGDSVLAEVGCRLGTGVRPDDLVARHGGDEFVVVCTDTNEARPAVIADRLAIALGGPIEFLGGSWQPAASIGWTRGMVGDDTTSVLGRADTAMFHHKRRPAPRTETDVPSARHHPHG